MKTIEALLRAEFTYLAFLRDVALRGPDEGELAYSACYKRLVDTPSVYVSNYHDFSAIIDCQHEPGATVTSVVFDRDVYLLQQLRIKARQ